MSSRRFRFPGPFPLSSHGCCVKSMKCLSALLTGHPGFSSPFPICAMQPSKAIFWRKKRNKMKKRTKEEEIGKGVYEPPARKVF